MTELKKIYKPIREDLEKVDYFISSAFEKATNKPIRDIGETLLGSPGKRMRPALVILSAKATESATRSNQLIKMASAVELIHMASLLHDDVIDHSRIRHNRPTVNSEWGKDVAIALGDYLYSVAFELISRCSNPDIIQCISCATKEMCEGELIQVCERDNLDLLKERYIVIIKKKTASLFAASCEIGALTSNSPQSLGNALKEYGLNFGIAFQIVDDYLDLAGKEEDLGKKPGQDIGVGEMTLPMLNLLESAPPDKRENLRTLLTSRKNKETLKEIKLMLFDPDALDRTKEAVSSYINKAGEKLDLLPSSTYKESLISLAGFIMEKGLPAT